MKKQSKFKLKKKLNELFKEPEDVTAPIKMCGDELINHLKTYSKNEIDYILNDEYYLIKFISRLNDYPTSMWSGRTLNLFKIVIEMLKEIKYNFNINFKITPKILIEALNIENLMEIYNFLEEKEVSKKLRNDLYAYFEQSPGFIDMKTPLSIRIKTQHDFLTIQAIEKIKKLEVFFNYNKSSFINIKKIKMYDKISNF